MNAREFMQTDVMIFGILLYALLGKLADTIARLLERQLLQWHPHYQKARWVALEKDITMHPSVHGTHLRIRYLTKAFGVKRILHDLHLEAAPGAFLTVVGKSGAGKSTLLRLIAGLERPSIGDILVDGALLRGRNTTARMMFQEARLLPWKRVGDNVSLGLQHRRDAMTRRALQQVVLLDRIGDWPATLSGGQRQRVALARASRVNYRCCSWMNLWVRSMH